MKDTVLAQHLYLRQGGIVIYLSASKITQQITRLSANSVGWCSKEEPNNIKLTLRRAESFYFCLDGGIRSSVPLYNMTIP